MPPRCNEVALKENTKTSNLNLYVYLYSELMLYTIYSKSEVINFY